MAGELHRLCIYTVGGCVGRRKIRCLGCGRLDCVSAWVEMPMFFFFFVGEAWAVGLGGVVRRPAARYIAHARGGMANAAHTLCLCSRYSGQIEDRRLAERSGHPLMAASAVPWAARAGRWLGFRRSADQGRSFPHAMTYGCGYPTWPSQPLQGWLPCLALT